MSSPLALNVLDRHSVLSPSGLLPVVVRAEQLRLVGTGETGQRRDTDKGNGVQ